MSELHYVSSGRIVKTALHLRFAPGELHVTFSSLSTLTLVDPILDINRKGLLRVKDTQAGRTYQWKLLAERDPGYGYQAGFTIVGQSVLAGPFVIFLMIFALPSWLRTRREIAGERQWHIDRLIQDARQNHIQLVKG